MIRGVMGRRKVKLEKKEWEGEKWSERRRGVRGVEWEEQE